jgi:putative FmdB family regulatory protein
VPRYDYKCVNCEHGFELVQTFAEAGNAVCPQCSLPLYVVDGKPK